ncbi:SDR family oxidoreductase [uncultured Paludibaculum sp.]|uniref:SDR family oxidoreductase n=1 Tax=uncultured Paludibaculum sp. TaxID=1765020 RepID=UPI002AAA6C43|nr:SDR family oxidoreductase [uncultured Paludibaculum sp.]
MKRLRLTVKALAIRLADGGPKTKFNNGRISIWCRTSMKSRRQCLSWSGKGGAHGDAGTAGLTKSAADAPDAQARSVASFAAQVPAGRIGEPKDVARAALFLASDDSTYVNGIELFEDGGFAQC